MNTIDEVTSFQHISVRNCVNWESIDERSINENYYKSVIVHFSIFYLDFAKIPVQKSFLYYREEDPKNEVL